MRNGNQNRDERPDFIEEYEILMLGAPNNPVIVQEWKEPGDYFAKITMYQPYTPIQTSSESVLCTD